MNLNDLIKRKRVYLDGAIGTEIIARGFSTADAERLNVSQPNLIKDITADYIKSGSDIVLTCTFGCNYLKLRCSEEELENIILSAIKNAKSATINYKNKFIGYSAGPLSELLKPYGKLSFEDAYEQYAAQAKIVAKCPTDFIMLETFTDVWMLKAAILAFKENCDLPVWCSMSFNDNGRTFSGTSVEAFAQISQGLGASVIGINCGFGPDKTYPLASRLTRCASVPIFIKPNAGLPCFKNGKTFYNTSAEDYALMMQKIASLGISILGGCCGTSPTYIKLLIDATENIPFTIFNNKRNAVCSSTDVVDINPFLIIGERVNPTGKPRLKTALAENDFDYVVSLCNEQLEKNADILDINVGMPGIDEPILLPNLICSIQCAVNCLLMIDTSNREAMKNALRIINGIPIINSVNGDDEVLDDLLPLAKKYGAYVVALCLNKDGIPNTTSERIEIAKHVLLKADQYEIEHSKFIFDPLTMAISVNTENAKITLQTVKILKSMGLNTVLGLSNISFGLPAREIINGAFLSLAKEKGLTAAIVNPSIVPNRDKYAIALLNGNDSNCENFIERYSGFVTEKKLCSEITLFESIVKGMKNQAVELVKLTANDNNYFSIINEVIIGALNEVGKRYEEGKYFLPQLIISAEAASAALEYIKSHYITEKSDSDKVMLIATVKGDIHDIGKNIVKAVLGNYGYKIYDLGRDVATETIIENIRLRKPKIIGLSALMTTSLENMKTAVKAIKNYDNNIIVVVGGAVVTEGFKNEIGADVYAEDAQSAVKKLEAIKF